LAAEFLRNAADVAIFSRDAVAVKKYDRRSRAAVQVMYSDTIDIKEFTLRRMPTFRAVFQQVIQENGGCDGRRGNGGSTQRRTATPRFVNAV
jgi:hypothetical protein